MGSGRLLRSAAVTTISRHNELSIQAIIQYNVVLNLLLAKGMKGNMGYKAELALTNTLSPTIPKRNERKDGIGRVCHNPA